MLSLTATDVKFELDRLRPNLIIEETEDSWEKISKALQALIKLCENGAYDASSSEMVNTMKASHRPIISAMNSERTRLCMVPMELMSALATAMGREFEQLLPLFMPALISQCARTNKVIINRAKSSILTIIEVTQLAIVLSYFLQNIKDKSTTMKVVIAEGTLACLNSCNPPDIEKEARAVEVESIIRATARDANADVRKLSRKIFECYQILLPSRVQSFSAPLSPTTKKYLEIKTATIATQKSYSNLRTNPNVKPEAKSSNAPTLTSTNTKPTHSRTASSSTISTGTGGNQVGTQPTLTRVTRKEPTPTAVAPAAPYVPVRPIQSSRTLTDPQKPNSERPTNTVVVASRKTVIQEGKQPIPPLRSKPSIISRSTTGNTGATSSSGAPHRVQLNPGANVNAGPSGSQPLASTGPRRIPMPPPPVPAPRKDIEGPKRPASSVGHIRPSSRVDNSRPSSRIDSAASTSRVPIPPSAPIKKKPTSTATLSSSLKAANPPTHTRSKPTTTTTTVTASKPTAAPAAPSGSGAVSGTSNTKPLAIAKAKPKWGQPAAAKPVPAASQKATTVKPAVISQKVPPVKTLAKKPSTRFVPTKGTVAAGPSKKRPITPAMVALPPSPTPDEVDEQINKEDEAESVQEAADAATSPRDSPVLASPSVLDSEVTDAEEQVVAEIEQVETVAVGSSTETTSTTTLVDPEEITSTPTIETEVEAVDDDDNDDTCIPLTNEDPQTPRPAGLMPYPSTNAMGGKTPISALLSSIERGFKYDYSPITPLSPAQNYLPNITGEGTPYSHATHAPHIKGPMQSFNHALHVSGHNGMFDGFAVEKIKKEEELVRGDIGVVHLSEYNKIYMPPGLPGLDDGRMAFVELNRS